MPATVARHRCSPGRRHAYVGKNTIIRPDRRVTPATLAAADSLAAAPRTAGWCLQSQGSSSYNLLKHSGSVTTWRKAWESRKRARDAASWGRKNVVCGPKSAIARADRLGAHPPPHLCRPAWRQRAFPSRPLAVAPIAVVPGRLRYLPSTHLRYLPSTHLRYLPSTHLHLLLATRAAFAACPVTVPARPAQLHGSRVERGSDGVCFSCRGLGMG